MKKLIMGIPILLVFILLFITGFLMPVYAAEPEWNFIDGGGAVGINYSCEAMAKNPVIVQYKGALYAAWQEQVSGSSYHIRIAKRDVNSGEWTSINIAADRGISRGMYLAENPRMAVYNNELYVAWEEYIETPENKNTVIFVSKYDGNTWTQVNDIYTDGRVNHYSNSNARQPDLAVFNGKLYAIWAEQNEYYRVVVRSYDGVNWEDCVALTDGLNTDGLNYNRLNTRNPALAVYNNKLYAAWAEEKELQSNKYAIRMKVFKGGTDWGSEPDNSGNISFDPSAAESDNPVMLEYDGSLYLSWNERPSWYFQIRLKKYHDSSSVWTTIEDSSNTDPASHNINTSKEAINPELYAYNNTLYLAWNEGDAKVGNTWTKRIRAKKYKNSAWSYVNTNGQTDGKTGINYDAGQQAINPEFVQYDDEIFLTWYETVPTANQQQIRVKRYPLPKVTTAAALSEANLDTGSISVALAGTSISGTLDKSNFTLENAPVGLTVESVAAGADNSHCTVNLAFDGSDFDSDISNLGLTIAGSQLTCGENLTARTALVIAAVKDTESISIDDDGNIMEGQENGEVITVTLTGGTFVSDLNPTNWGVDNLPEGVHWTVSKENSTTAKITLSGNARTRYTGDITNLTVTCNTSEYRDSSGGTTLSDNSGVTLKKAENLPAFEMLGAEKRTQAPAGLRFKARLIKNPFFNSGKIQGYGIVILPTNLIPAGQELTLATVPSNQDSKPGSNILNIASQNIFSQDGSHLVFTGVLTNIPDDARSITARAYVTYLNTGNQPQTVYSDPITSSVNTAPPGSP